MRHHTTGGNVTTEQREKLREVLIDYLQVLTTNAEPLADRKISEVRLLLREVA
jgi:hypothetical protein